MENKKKKHSKWHGYRPGSGKKYDPNDPHFNPMHPPKGYPKDLLKGEWEEPKVTIIRDDNNGEEESRG